MQLPFVRAFVYIAVVTIVLTGARVPFAQESQEAPKSATAVPEVTEIGSGVDKFLSALRQSSRARARANAPPCQASASHPMFQLQGPDLSFLSGIEPEIAAKMLLLQGELMVTMGETLIEHGQTMQENGYR